LKINTKGLEKPLQIRLKQALKMLLKVQKGLFKAYHQDLVEVFIKNEREWVTQYDLWVDKILKKELAQFFNDAWISEESTPLQSNTGYSWILDPIDGTNNFAKKVPFFCVSLALCYQDKTIAGFIFDVVHNTLYCAYNQKSYIITPFKTQEVLLKPLKLKEAVVSFGVSHAYLDHCQELKEGWIHLEKKTLASRRYGSAALEIVFVGLQKLGFYWIMGHHIWDVAAALLFVENIGIKVLNLPLKNTLVVYHPHLQEGVQSFLNQIENHH